MDLKINDEVYVQSYKHDGSLHRTWAKAYVIEVSEEVIVAVTNKTWVSESNGRSWFTKEPAICFFYPNKWFNVISMIRKTGIYYYCNLASPSLYDGEAIKNIDYDLDVKVYPNDTYSILDEDEYAVHSARMRYPEEIKYIVEKQLTDLLKMVENKESPFKHKEIHQYYRQYLEMLNDKNSSS
ncbi:MAG: DUF402 domain-containing protein [Erysipelotrichaceae bacterium]